MTDEHDCQGASCKCWDPYGARCKAKGCDKPVKARGLCQRHYGHWWQFERPGGKRCRVPNDSDGAPCNRPAIGNGLCFTHYQRLRLYGRLTRQRPKFDRPAQQAILQGMRQGMTMAAAARAAGWNASSVKAMLVKGRSGESPSMRRFAEEADVILRPRRRTNLSPAARTFLEELEQATARSLRQDSSRWVQKTMPQTKHHQGSPEPGRSRSA